MITYDAWPRFVQDSATEQCRVESLALAVHLEGGRLVEALEVDLLVVVQLREVAFAGPVTVHIATRQG
jgi:hypothetical protein